MNDKPAKFNPFGKRPTGVELSVIKADWDQRAAYMTDVLAGMCANHYKALIKNGMPHACAQELTDSMQNAWLFEYYREGRDADLCGLDDDDDNDDDPLDPSGEEWKAD